MNGCFRVRRFVELNFNRLKLFHLRLQLGDFLFQPHGVGLGDCWFLPIGSIKCRQVTVDARFNFFRSPLQFGLVKLR